MGAVHFSGPVYSDNGFGGASGENMELVGYQGYLAVLAGNSGAGADVNYISLYSNVTTVAPSIYASGSDTNVGLNITSKGTGSVTLWTGSLAREALILANTASAVNEITITQAATGNAPLIAASGETNVGLGLSSKGTGSVTLWTGNAGREALILPNVASAVNEVTITQAITAVAPTIAASGGDTNIGLNIAAKGTAQVLNAGAIVGKTTVTTTTTAGAATYTAAQMLGGLILRDPNGAGRSDVTPTAALLVAALPGCAIGTSFQFTIVNTADANETITVTAGSGATLVGTMTIAQSNNKTFLAVLDNVTGGAEAYTLYSLGTVTT